MDRWEQLKINVDKCWLHVANKDFGGKVHGPKVFEFLLHVEQRLDITFTEQERRKLNLLLLENPNVSVKRCDGLRFLQQLGNTINESREGLKSSLSSLSTPKTGNNEGRTQVSHHEANLDFQETMNSSETSVITESEVKYKVEFLENENIRLQSLVHCLEGRLLLQPEDRDMSRLLKINYENNKQIAALGKIKDAQAAKLRDAEKKEALFCDLMVRISEQEDLIQRLLKKSTILQSASLKPQQSVSSTDIARSMFQQVISYRNQHFLFDRTRLRRVFTNPQKLEFWKFLGIVLTIPYALVIFLKITRALLSQEKYAVLQEVPFLEYCVYSFQTWSGKNEIFGDKLE